MTKKEKKNLISQLERVGIEVIESDSNTIMSKTIISEQVIDKLFDEDLSLIKVYDVNNKIHFRIAVQEIKTNREFICRIRKIIN